MRDPAGGGIKENARNITIETGKRFLKRNVSNNNIIKRNRGAKFHGSFG